LRSRPSHSLACAIDPLSYARKRTREAAVIERLIRKLENCGPVSEEERRFLEQPPSRVRDYRPHEDIAREGDCPAESYLVVEGFACRYKLLPGGARQIMALHVPGDFCDLHSFSLKRMDHSIAAVSQCRIVRFPHAVINDITERYPQLTRALLWDAAIDGAIMRQWMISMGRRSAYQQIAHLLCELFLRLRVRTENHEARAKRRVRSMTEAA
jgi:CRP-like cAMP-binding protein